MSGASAAPFSAIPATAASSCTTTAPIPIMPHAGSAGR